MFRAPWVSGLDAVGPGGGLGTEATPHAPQGSAEASHCEGACVNFLLRLCFSVTSPSSFLARGRNVVGVLSATR